MTHNEFRRLLVSAADHHNLDQFIADLLPISDDIARTLPAIWNLRALDFPAIRQLSGLSQTGFAREYSIPHRTIQDWEAGLRTAPPYLLELLAFAVISNQAE